ncbi:hypothetical protein HOLleu_03743 [Holothuria leucospilota]|uniref:Uncharacterized protein n=1 Tax=Holothuria leucospilota TaxID=206669 RepID=A0A9Q1CS06_HOLLE|nr:hypothetical protein HOLleu_03743 [Holothuria leucospilota]
MFNFGEHNMDTPRELTRPSQEGKDNEEDITRTLNQGSSSKYVGPTPQKQQKTAILCMLRQVVAQPYSVKRGGEQIRLETTGLHGFQ